MAFIHRLAWAAPLCLALLLVLPSDARAQAGEGRIAGLVVDRQTGRPVAGAEVAVGDRRVLTDLAGRYRTPPLPAGSYTVTVTMVGYSQATLEDVEVEPGETVALDVSLAVRALEIEGIAVQAERTRRGSSEAALLAMQKAAPSVTDGISAQQISRSPDSDAADAITRVTGVSVVDDKYVVVRGLGERYGNTLLNGAELASPEPLKKVVPLDIFPASLLESVVTTKTATPDKPGNFAGGSVEITTKDFPEDFVAQVSLSQGWNSTTTFRSLALLPRGGTDFLARDDGGRAMPSAPPPGPEDDNLSRARKAERFGEEMRNVWRADPATVRPNLGFSFNVGDQIGSFENALGYMLALTYSSDVSHSPDEYFMFTTDSESGTPVQFSRSDQTTSTVDWGIIGNLALRLGSRHRVAFKNMYTRNAEEFLQFAEASDVDSEWPTRIHQVRYLERQLAQTRLTGEHGLPLGLRFSWSGSYSRAERDEPDSRSLEYAFLRDRYELAPGLLSPVWFRFLGDDVYSYQVDLSRPFDLWGVDDALIKVGALYRQKDRVFDVFQFQIVPLGSAAPDGLDSQALPPEQILSPENLGRNVLLQRVLTSGGQPYRSDDNLVAYYGMLDIPILRWLRVVGGVRVEEWNLDLRQGLAELTPGVPQDTSVRSGVVLRENRDPLWSTNVTVSLGQRTNLRLAGYQTVSRPEPRELNLGGYTPVSGQCANNGNPDLVRTLILNGDIRLEHYPAPGELLSIAGFFKEFDKPIVEFVGQQGVKCEFTPLNVESGTNLGVEVEARKNLGFLGGLMEPFSAGANFTYTAGELLPGDEIQTPYTSLPLHGQSEYLVNGSLSYASEAIGFEATLLANYFSDRALRYGTGRPGGGAVPHVYEEGRLTLDAKASKELGSFSMSVSGKNLTDQRRIQYQETESGPVTVGWQHPGVSVSVSVGYAF